MCVNWKLLSANQGNHFSNFLIILGSPHKMICSSFFYSLSYWIKIPKISGNSKFCETGLGGIFICRCLHVCSSVWISTSVVGRTNWVVIPYPMLYVKFPGDCSSWCKYLAELLRAWWCYQLLTFWNVQVMLSKGLDDIEVFFIGRCLWFKIFVFRANSVLKKLLLRLEKSWLIAGENWSVFNKNQQMYKKILLIFRAVWCLHLFVFWIQHWMTGRELSKCYELAQQVF